MQQLKGEGQPHTFHGSKSAFDLGQSGVQIGLNSKVMPWYIARRRGRACARGQKVGSEHFKALASVGLA